MKTNVLTVVAGAGVLALAWNARAPSLTLAEANAVSYDKNVQAFLAAIRHAEGTAGNNGYRELFGGGLFWSYADHPRVTVSLPAHKPDGTPYTLSSTAAGAYQILAKTWDSEIQPALHLPDFSPSSQDLAAIYLIRRRGALEDVRAGRFAEAIRKCAKEWASLPGSPYGQPHHSLAELESVYSDKGGALA